VLAPIHEAPQLGLLSIDGSASTLAGTGLPTAYSPSLSFSGSEDGFARIESEPCSRPPGARTSTTSTSAPTVGDLDAHGATLIPREGGRQVRLPSR